MRKFLLTILFLLTTATEAWSQSSVTTTVTAVDVQGRALSSFGTARPITGSAAIVTNIAATTGTSSGDFTFKGLTIEYVGGN